MPIQWWQLINKLYLLGGLKIQPIFEVREDLNLTNHCAYLVSALWGYKKRKNLAICILRIYYKYMYIKSKNYNAMKEIYYAN